MPASRPFLVLTTIAFTCSCTPFAAGENTEPPKTMTINGQPYTLSFNDEFGGRELDTTKWRHRILGGGSSHPLFFTEDASWLDGDGHLVMALYTQPKAELDPEVAERFPWQRWIPYASMLMTREEFTYGYHEVRLRMPIVAGAGAAVWMQSRGQTSRTPSADPKVGAEIDLLEQTFIDKYGKPCDFKHATIHWGGYGETHQWVSITVRPEDKRPAEEQADELNLTNEDNDGGGLVHENRGFYSDALDFRDEQFHKVAVLWTPELYQFYYDDQLIGTIEKGVSQSPGYMILGPRLFTFDKLVDSTDDGLGDRQSTAAKYLIDYYRVYQPAP